MKINSPLSQSTMWAQFIWLYVGMKPPISVCFEEKKKNQPSGHLGDKKKSNFSYLGPVLDGVLWKREEVCQDRIPEVSSADSDKFHWDFHFQKQWRRNLLSHEAEQWALMVFGSLRGGKKASHASEKADKKHFCDLDLLLELAGRPVVVHTAHHFSLMGCGGAGWHSLPAPGLHTGEDMAAHTRQ